MADDAELVRRVVAGDAAAAGEVYDRYANLVRAVLLDATASVSDANELVQEVFLKALSQIGRLRQPEKLCGWLVGIARRQGAEYRRLKARERRRITPLISDPPESRPETLDEEVILVRQAISELPERERLAIHIHYLSGEPAEAARSVLGMSPAGFYKLLARARERLRRALLHVESER
jgi:RNA polymerase sigma-70 factor (ECF subfamily)